MSRALCSAVLLLLTQGAGAEPLPEPLSLEQALALSRVHPALQLARAGVQVARANLDSVLATDDLQLSLTGTLQYLEPAELSPYQEHNDSRLALKLSKVLYDFGYSRAGEAAARKKLEGRRRLEQEAIQNRHLKVMAAFFDVLLADLQFRHDREARTIVFARLDSELERRRLGQTSDIDLLETQSDYQQATHLRAVSASRQRLARSKLAVAMNRPGELVSDLVTPPLPELRLPSTDLETVLGEVRRDNPRILWLRAALESAGSSVEQAGSRFRPVLRGELEAREYYRETHATSPFTAALVLEVPLYTGGLADSEVAIALAEEAESQALLNQSVLDMEQRVVELWLELETLLVRFQELQASDDYQELYLDRNRTLYEMEVASDFGDATVRAAELDLQKGRAQFQWMLTVAKLNALRGALSPPQHRDNAGEY